MNSFAVCQDASRLATGDLYGIIKLFGIAYYNLVHQFASQDPVFDLCLAVGFRRHYEVRGSHGNVWEPNALRRLSESTETSANSVRPRSLDAQSTRLRSMPGKIDPVAAPQHAGQLYWSGTESGPTETFEANRGNVAARLFNPVFIAEWPVETHASVFNVAIIPIAAFPDPSSHSAHKQPQSPKIPTSNLHLGSDQFSNIIYILCV